MKESLKIVTTDATVLSATRFIPDNANGKVILINSATGVKQTYYEKFAVFLAGQGFHVYTYDYRGIGESRPKKLRGYQATMKDWGIYDYESMLKNIFQTHSQFKVIVIGHSIGGQIVGFSNASTKVDLIVMVGAQTPYWKNYPGLWTSIKLFYFWYLAIPFFTKIIGFFPAKKLGLFEDLPGGVAKQWTRWAKSSNYIFDELPEMKLQFSKLHLNALMISAEDDALAPLKAVKALMESYGGIRWSHWHLKPEDILQKRIGHFGFFRNKMQSSLWSEMVTWINKPFQLREIKAA